MNKILTRLLVLEFKSDNTIKPKAMKYIVKKILRNYNQRCLTLFHIKYNGNALRQL